MSSRPLKMTGLAALLAALGMLGPFSIDTFFPAFKDVARDFSASDVQMQMTISLYLLGFALTSLIYGPLSDAYGRRPVILWSLHVFVLASIGATLAPSIEVLLVFRFAQGLSAGAGTIVGRAIVRDCYDGADAQRLMSRITLIFALAPAIAPIIGGMIHAVSPWRAIFVAITLFGAALLLLTWARLSETHPPERREPFALNSLLNTCVGIFLNVRFGLYCTAAAFNFGALFLYIASAPAIVLDLLKLQPTQFAYLFIPAIAGIIIGSQISGLIAGRMSARRTIVIAYALMFSATAWNLTYSATHATMVWPWAVQPIMVYGIGSSLAFPTLTLKMLDLYPQHRGSASSVQTFSSLALNALIAGVLSPLVAQSGWRLALAAAALMLIGASASALIAWNVRPSAR
jgi:MFS transporter, DHA1 family, multidrug resistance protein